MFANRKRDFGTWLHVGLEKSLNEMFNVANGARPNAKKALILATDGGCSGCTTDVRKTILSNLALRIKEENIKMFMIGIHKKYDQITRFNITELLGTDAFSEVNEYGDLMKPDLLNKMAMICDAM